MRERARKREAKKKHEVCLGFHVENILKGVSSLLTHHFTTNMPLGEHSQHGIHKGAEAETTMYKHRSVCVCLRPLYGFYVRLHSNCRRQSKLHVEWQLPPWGGLGGDEGKRGKMVGKWESKRGCAVGECVWWAARLLGLEFVGGVNPGKLPLPDSELGKGVNHGTRHPLCCRRLIPITKETPQMHHVSSLCPSPTLSHLTQQMPKDHRGSWKLTSLLLGCSLVPSHSFCLSK